MLSLTELRNDLYPSSFKMLGFGRLDFCADGFDKITVAGSAILDIPLVTKDQLILQHFPLAVW